MVVESFTLDHTKVKAPYVRKCCVLNGKHNDKVTKFDLRFTQPNVNDMESSGLHTLEHWLATFLREQTDDIIDLSPMGCRTGFYLTMWGDVEVDYVINILTNALNKALEQTEIPGANEVACGNYKLHDMALAKKYATDVLNKGISDKFYK